MGSNGVEFESEHSSRRSSPAPGEYENNVINLVGVGELQQLSSLSTRGGQKSSVVGCSGSAAQAGWAEPAVAANQQPTCVRGMWSPQNPNGTPLQGWDRERGDLYAFAHFSSVCESCEQVFHAGFHGKVSLEPSSCNSPAFQRALDRGRAGDHTEALICCNRPVRERWYALEVLATLVQDENWTLCFGEFRQAEYLDCLHFYLNQQFLKLVEQGKVLQCFDETGRAVWTCFCTGLLSSKEESIYCVLQRNNVRPSEIGAKWAYNCFATSRELLETRQPWNAVEPILIPPEKATFFDNHVDLLYLPSGQGDNIQLDPQIWDGLENYLPLFPKSLVKSSVTFQAQKQAVISALQRAVQMLQYNPFMAVPQYQGFGPKMPGALQLLLPMKLDPDSDTTHLALVLEISKSRRGGHMYRATRMMELPYAYLNARVLMPVCQPWLSSCAFTCELAFASKGHYTMRQSRTATDHHHGAGLYCELKPRSSASAPASFNVDESLSRSCFGIPESWGCIPRRSSTIAQKGKGSLSSPLSFHTTPDSTSPISPLALVPYGTTPSAYPGESSTSNSGVAISSIAPLPHHQVLSPRNTQAGGIQAGGNARRAFVDIYSVERRSIRGTGVTFPLYSETILQGSSGSCAAKFSSFDETGLANGSFEQTCIQGLSLTDREQRNSSEGQDAFSFSQGADPTRQTNGYSAMADLGGHTWGVSSMGPSLCPAITSDLTGESLGSANDLPLAFIPASSLSPDYVAQSRQGAASAASCEMSRLGPMGFFPSHGWSSVDLSAIGGEFDGHTQDEYVQFTPQDDACPKVNISQLPPRFVAEYLSGDLPGIEQAAEHHTSQVFGRYGTVARSLVRENKNHPGKWFAIVEFAYWTDDTTRLQLINGMQVRFPDFYGQEDVVFRRHKDKQKNSFCTQGATLSPGASCRPLWTHTGSVTKYGKPLYKGPCAICGRESTVPFKPVVNGQPPRCRNCFPPAAPAAELMLQGQQQSQPLPHNILPYSLNE